MFIRDFIGQIVLRKKLLSDGVKLTIEPSNSHTLQ